MSDDRLIVALDVPNVVQGLDLANRIGDAASFYKIGLGMLTGGGLSLARELKDERGTIVFPIGKESGAGNVEFGQGILSPSRDRRRQKSRQDKCGPGFPASGLAKRNHGSKDGRGYLAS